MQASFHRLVQADLNGILTKYYGISDRLAEDLFAEFQRCIQNACANPKAFHFDASSLRRCNFDRFPYHFLYDVRGEHPAPRASSDTEKIPPPRIPPPSRI